jgi:hypothetical protein
MESISLGLHFVTKNFMITAVVSRRLKARAPSLATGLGSTSESASMAICHKNLAELVHHQPYCQLPSKNSDHGTPLQKRLTKSWFEEGHERNACTSMSSSSEALAAASNHGASSPSLPSGAAATPLPSADPGAHATHTDRSASCLRTTRISTPNSSPLDVRSTKTASWGGGSTTMSWDWSRSATWSLSSPADQSGLMRNPRSPLKVAVGEDDWTVVAAAVAKEGVPGGAGARR